MLPHLPRYAFTELWRGRLAAFVVERMSCRRPRLGNPGAIRTRQRVSVPRHSIKAYQRVIGA